MRNLLLLCVAVFGFGFAQAQDHTVLAGNYYYNPATLTVTAGETIEFLNEGGFHNVNGVSSTLGDTWNNPEDFSLGANSGTTPAVSMGTITLNTPGTYNYDCSIGDHADQGMVGTIIVEAAATTTSNITFTVDIPANITVAGDGMHIAGTMTSWQGEPMSDNGDGTWSKTYALEDGDVSFKFQNGLDGWESTQDRTYTVAGADAEYSACWESTLSECPGVVPVTFQVDMANAGLVGGETITVAGSMTGWCGGCVEMTDDDADGVYTATMDLGMNSEFEFKYLINGYANDGGTEENMIGTACDWNPSDAFGNRGFATAEASLTLDVVCFNYCGTCEEQNNDGGGDPTGPTDNAADPTEDANDVASIYGGTYAAIATNYNPFWGQSGSVNTDYDPGTGNFVLEYANFNYQGTEITPTDLSSMTHLHVDVWVAEGTDRQLKVSPVNNGGGTPETLVNVPLTPGSWSSVDLAKADFTGMTWDNVIQMKFDGQFNGDGSTNTAPWTVYIDNLYFYNDGSGDNGGGGDPGDGGGDGTALVSLTFDDAASVDSWQAVADATLPEASLAWNAAGVETGALEVSGTNTADDAGRAYIFQYVDGNVDYAGSSDVTLSFDIKAGSPLVGAAVHLQTEFPGAGTINTFDIQNSGINENDWTTLSYDFSGVSGDGIFRIQFNIAAGAFSGAGGTLLVDNISLTGSGSGGGGGTEMVDVTWNVNMANVVTAAEGVYVAGGADFGVPGTNPMTDTDGDDVWTLTVQVPVGYSGYYTFTNGACADYSCKEDIAGQACADAANYNDRQLVNITENTVINTCFGECTTDGSCTPVVVGDPLVATLDASCSGIAEITEVRIFGPFWGWDPAGGPVATLNSEGLYEVVFSPAPDADMEYKWLINGTQEDLLDFGPDLNGDGYDDFLNADCVPITDYYGYANRQWTVGSGDIVDTWSQCAPCETIECPLDSAMVTITVDMSEEEVNPIGVFVAGTFQEWTPGATLATDNGDGTWSHSFMAGVGDTVQYKWMNGTAWGFEEVVPSDCQYPGDSNRGFEVPCEDYSHPVHCYSSCNPCGAATYDVTFTVLTDNIMVDAGGMYLAGAPTGWSPTAMSDNGDGSWSITLSLEVGSAEFKFQNGEGGWEELDCGGNRSVTVDGSGPVSYTGCFAQCGETTECAVDPDPANVTFRLDMSAEDSISTDGVFLTGSFTSPVWQAGAIAMDDADGDLIYEATVLISGPAGIAYKFFNGNPYPDNVSTEEGGETADFAAAGCGVDNGVGGFNRTHDRSGADETLDVVCFNSCNACGPEGTAVTFSVDMNSYGSAFGFVNVSGTWNEFCADCNQMTDDDMDGIWTTTIYLPEGDNYRYKFQVDAWNDQEDLAPDNDAVGPCVVTEGGYTNRDLDIAGADPIDLGVVCWGSCLACGDGGTPGCTDDTASNYDASASYNDGTCLYDVTFNVNMSQYALAEEDSVYVNGTFNGWCGPCNPLFDEDGDGIYSVTIELAYDYYEYKFTVNGWTAEENLAGIGSCVTENFGYTNRVLQLAGDQVQPVVCWNSCSDCEGVDILGCTDSSASNYSESATSDDGSCLYPITFQVDMAGYAGTYTTVNLNGSFTSPAWCGGCVEMTDADMDGVYEVTLDVGVGTVEYKYTVDGWTDQESLTEGDVCTSTIGGYTNRTFDVSGAATLDVVCWNSCYACDAPVGCTDENAQNYDSGATIDDGSCSYMVTLRVDMSQQDVSPNGVHVAGAFQNWDPAGTPLSTQGLGLYEITLQLTNGSYQFIYVNDNVWDGQETVPAECGVDNGLGGFNREVVVSGADAVLDVVCFGSCTACPGCTDPFSAEFNPFAGSDDGSCETALVFGCTYSDADNYNPAANSEDGSCEFSGGGPCPTDIDGDGSTAVGDLLIILGAFGQPCD